MVRIEDFQSSDGGFDSPGVTKTDPPSVETDQETSSGVSCTKRSNGERYFVGSTPTFPAEWSLRHLSSLA